MRLEIRRRAVAGEQEGAMEELSVSRSHVGARRATILIRVDGNPAAELCGVCGAATDMVPVLVPVRYPNGAYSVRPSSGAVLL